MKIFCLFFLFILTVALFLPPPILAVASPIGITQPSGAGIPVNNKNRCDADTFVGQIIQAALAIIFTIAAVAILIMVLWGLTELILSAGDKEKVGNARKRITYALVGLVILALSFVIIQIIGQVTGFNPLNKLGLPDLTGYCNRQNQRGLPKQSII